MKHFAANYVFDGRNFIKNCRLSFDDNGYLSLVGAENSGIEEKERMIFLNGILCPHFDVNKLINNKLSLRDFLVSLDLCYDKNAHLPVVLLEAVDLQTLNFTNYTIAKEIF